MPHHRPVYLYDDGLGHLAPLTDLRPAFDIRTGALTALARCKALLGEPPTGLFVPPRLADLTRAAHVLPVNERPKGRDPVLLVNGRWAHLDPLVIEDLAAEPAGRSGAGRHFPVSSCPGSVLG